MPITITVPRLGWSMDEGVFVAWLKKDGDPVKAGEPLFTLEGDKASQDVEATDSGILQIPPDAPKAGATVLVGALLGYLLSDGETFRPPPPSPSLQHSTAPSLPPSSLPPPPHPSATSSAAQGTTISPRARRRAEELGVDYRPLKGRGRTGRIVEADVLAAAKPPPVQVSSAMRRTIAHRTAQSFARAPHFYLTTEVNATALLELREHLLAKVKEATGARLTLSDLLLRAQGLALRVCPFANAIWQDDTVVKSSACDVGLVVGLNDGLLLPIIRRADEGDIAAVAKQRRLLVEAARTGRLPVEATQGGATSLSNLGNTCVDEFAAVIAPPHSSMLAVGRASPRPFVVNGQLAVRTTLKLCLSVDHRVMDGGPAAEFLGHIVALIERPAALARE
jgi:pyruvate dehydrogenase E2 component (dihydrolipoamide acetyltransferase)